MKLKNDTVVIAYVATPHQGYVNFFKEYRGAVLYILGRDVTKDFKSLVRNLPGNEPEDVVRMVKSLGIFTDVVVWSHETFENLSALSIIVMPDEDVSRAFAKHHLSDRITTFDGRWRLRWHWDSVHQKKRPESERIVSTQKMDRDLISRAYTEGTKSSDWWRQIGALLSRNGEVLLVSHNTHFPSEQSPYLYGDPRSQFDPGQSIEMSSALHAEVGILTEAARQGIKTEGCDLYVTTFPCPPCALAVANSGVKRLYYADGYSLVDGAVVLESRGVEIIRVEMNDPSP